MTDLIGQAAAVAETIGTDVLFVLGSMLLVGCATGALDDREARIVEKVESLTGDLDENQGAFIVTLAASFHKGSMWMM